MRRLKWMGLVVLLILASNHIGFAENKEAAQEKPKEIKKINLTYDIVESYCTESFVKSGKCPDACNIGCLGGVLYDGCQVSCAPKSCLDQELKNCPTDTCTVIRGCSGEDICYPKAEATPPKCGGLAYAWDDVECCEGFVRRCGVEYFDGSCDMEATQSIYAAPTCLPCGNGVCNQFENSCNCPEDCNFRK